MAESSLFEPKDARIDYTLLFTPTELLLIVRTEFDVGESTFALIPLGETLNFRLAISFFGREASRLFC